MNIFFLILQSIILYFLYLDYYQLILTYFSFIILFSKVLFIYTLIINFSIFIQNMIKDLNFIIIIIILIMIYLFKIQGLSGLYFKNQGYCYYVDYVIIRENSIHFQYHPVLLDLHKEQTIIMVNSIIFIIFSQSYLII